MPKSTSDKHHEEDSRLRSESEASKSGLMRDHFAHDKAVLITVALVLSVFVPFLVWFTPPGSTVALLTAAAMPLGWALLLIVRPGVHEFDSPEGRPADQQAVAALLLYLSPVLLLNVVYPLASPAMAQAVVGGVPLTVLVLASSVTVPWLAQAACLPIYRALGDLMAGHDMSAITRRFFESWPVIFAQSVPLVGLYASALWVATGWSISAVVHYAALCVLHLIFVQSLVLANVANRRGLWALAWSAYATALMLAPTIWWLPPLLGTATQLVALRRGLRHLGIARRLPSRLVAADLVRGLLMGAVLWADKFFLFLVTNGQFEVVAVFGAMLPAAVAYNFYFVRLAPKVDDALKGLHAAVAGAPLSTLRSSSRHLVRVVDRSVVLTGAVAALLTLSVSLAFSAITPAQAWLVVSASLASWALMMLTLVSYELDFIGEKRTPQFFGAAHLAACVAAFVIVTQAAPLGSHVGSYILLGVVDIALIGVAWKLYKYHWREPEFTLFWRHATSW